jgi:hypothetical protein
MKTIIHQLRNALSKNFQLFFSPVEEVSDTLTPFKSRGKRKLKMTFQDFARVLVYYHLHEFSSGAEMLQKLEEDEFAKRLIAPKDPLKKSTFHEYLNERGLEQFQGIFDGLMSKSGATLPKEFMYLGELVSVDGSFIDSVLSMNWADYREGSKKAKAHVGYNVNQGAPCGVFITDGKTDERLFADKLVLPGQTGIYDRYYQCHRNFDEWRDQSIHFVCRIRANTTLSISATHEVPENSHIISDVMARLGSQPEQQTKTDVRVVTYEVEGKIYLVATDRMDLTAEEVAHVYKLRWSIESFFKWWKKHLGVYHLISRNENGLKVQILAGLSTYLLLKIYCHEQHGSDVTIEKVRTLRNQIHNEIAESLAEEIRRKKKRRQMKKSKKKAKPKRHAKP